MTDDFDIVIQTLQEKRDILWKMTNSNMNADMFNIMDEIRLEQIDQLDKAIKLWNINRGADINAGDGGYKIGTEEGYKEFANKRNYPLCYCYKCADNKTRMTTMIVCPECGNKRCPKATDHNNECTNSNEVGQDGSRY
jgi:hypothetical protein